MSKKVDKLFLSIGSMRSGTTWLYKLLREHPEVYFTRQKELHFIYDYFSGSRMMSMELPIWDRNYICEPLQSKNIHSFDERLLNLRRIYQWGLLQLNWSPTWEYYHSLFSLRGDEKWCGDMCNLTSMLKPHQLGEMKSEFDEVKVIYLVRDPLKRLWSHFVYHNKNNGPVEFKEDNWTPELYDEWLYLKKRWVPLSWDYTTAIQNGFEGFGDNFRVFYYEDLLKSPRGVLKGLEDFLEINHYNYHQHDIEKYINVASNGHDMWDGFRDHMMPVLSRQVERLSKQIPIHSDWNNYENST